MAQPAEPGRCAVRARSWSQRNGHTRSGTMVWPARFTGGLPVDEVFTFTTGAPQGGGWVRWWRAGLTRAGCPRQWVEMRRRGEVLK
jgi:hypothetical protein